MSTTKTIHALNPDPSTGSFSTPVFQTSTFLQEAPDVHKGFDYSRSANPTRKSLEDLIARLEHGQAGFAFSSGMAAIDAVLKTLSSGDEIVAIKDIYGGTYRLIEEFYRKLGISAQYIDTTDLENIAQAVTSKTKLIWIETPTNPTLQISDLKAISKIAKKIGAYLVVDNTFATPVAQKPIDFGADIVVHSATKYIGGHSDVIAGLVAVKTEELAEEFAFIQNSSGGVLGPWDCFLCIRGIETIDIRFQKQCETSLTIAKFLEKHEAVHQVYYPGLETHKNHELAKEQQNGLFGGIISFSLKEDTAEAAEKFVKSTKYFKLAVSLGGVKSLLCIPYQMTHSSVPREKKLAAGICDSLIRLSPGIEEPEDLIDDLKNAFQTIEEKAKVEHY